ncbi:HD-GYP domain-containing protein [Tunturibacter empetritectus]|uniref:Nucleotidyltransferase with HDIG domain n=1 Tax=Tunturiibacter lichenicola TaxID=2051959 RepID=A0A7W8J894_9BACT|nr:HD domain-containing phosphohydrolase [Edaphobacter lichenicola]MBB5344353.1 putative nucleotidyltransferase with HDIG domain [Edaphobacter lichenicola]
MSSSLSNVATSSYEGALHNPNSLPFSALIPALSFVLDLTEGHPMGHVLRSCMIGMRIGERAGLSQEMLSHLYSAILFKDVGCKGNSSRTLDKMAPNRNSSLIAKTLSDNIDSNSENTRTSKHTRTSSLCCGWAQTLPQSSNILSSCSTAESFDTAASLPCERAARIARDLGLPFEVCEAIYQSDERWDDVESIQGVQGEEISLLARIIKIAQTLDIAAERYGPVTAIDLVARRCSRWFGDGLLTVSDVLHDHCELWSDLQSPEILSHVINLAPEGYRQCPNIFLVDNICLAFAEVVDAKSPFTFTHSTGVARIAVSIAKVMGLDSRDTKLLERAALLHDIGKLGVPNVILEKPGKLTTWEWHYIYKHPQYTKEILDKIPGFEEIAEVAAAHHEKLDGSGYPRGLQGPQLPLLARILTVADIYDALSSSRPYRQKLQCEEVLTLMQDDAPLTLDQSCMEALTMAMRQ